MRSWLQATATEVVGEKEWYSLGFSPHFIFSSTWRIKSIKKYAIEKKARVKAGQLETRRKEKRVTFLDENRYGFNS